MAEVVSFASFQNTTEVKKKKNQWYFQYVHYSPIKVKIFFKKINNNPLSSEPLNLKNYFEVPKSLYLNISLMIMARVLSVSCTDLSRVQ